MADDERQNETTLALAVEATAQTPEALVRRVAQLEELVVSLIELLHYRAHYDGVFGYLFYGRRPKERVGTMILLDALLARRAIRAKAGLP